MVDVDILTQIPMVRLDSKDNEYTYVITGFDDVIEVVYSERGETKETFTIPSDIAEQIGINIAKVAEAVTDAR